VSRRQKGNKLIFAENKHLPSAHADSLRCLMNNPRLRTSCFVRGFTLAVCYRRLAVVTTQRSFCLASPHYLLMHSESLTSLVEKRLCALRPAALRRRHALRVQVGRDVLEQGKLALQSARARVPQKVPNRRRLLRL